MYEQLFENLFRENSSLTRKDMAVVGIDLGRDETCCSLGEDVVRFPTALARDKKTLAAPENLGSAYVRFLRVPGDAAKECYDGDWAQPTYENLMIRFFRAATERILNENRERLIGKKHIFLCVSRLETGEWIGRDEAYRRILSRSLDFPGFEGRLHVLICSRARAAVFATKKWQQEYVCKHNYRANNLIVDCCDDGYLCIECRGRKKTWSMIPSGAPLWDTLRKLDTIPQKSMDWVFFLEKTGEDTQIHESVKKAFKPYHEMVLPDLARELVIWGKHVCERNLLIHEIRMEILERAEDTGRIVDCIRDGYTWTIWNCLSDNTKKWDTSTRDTLKGLFEIDSLRDREAYAWNKVWNNIINQVNGYDTYKRQCKIKAFLGENSWCKDYQFIPDSKMTYPILQKYIPFEMIDKVYWNQCNCFTLFGYLKGWVVPVSDQPISRAKRKEYGALIRSRETEIRKSIRGMITIPVEAAVEIQQVIKKTVTESLINYLDDNSYILIGEN